MAEEIDSVILEILEDFGTVHTTEDPRTGIDRRHHIANDFPIKDNHGKVVLEDRRNVQDRRTECKDIDDVSEYESK